MHTLMTLTTFNYEVMGTESSERSDRRLWFQLYQRVDMLFYDYAKIGFIVYLSNPEFRRRCKANLTSETQLKLIGLVLEKSKCDLRDAVFEVFACLDLAMGTFRNRDFVEDEELYRRRKGDPDKLAVAHHVEKPRYSVGAPLWIPFGFDSYEIARKLRAGVSGPNDSKYGREDETKIYHVRENSPVWLIGFLMRLRSESLEARIMRYVEDDTVVPEENIRGLRERMGTIFDLPNLS
ncbi:hypothetical protein BJ508DRAFT_367176 [Ascobolus immersus RN42]|uniref:Uncharacterized protein n=1 Tax=Ascobolus immersus RN42 TaxID=1160509 RepID=A0A3N4HIR6_ASCIM|nr:hypothetical protein BJ508DRAFT_367176 [Ascobolus immersus RN42]